MKSNGNTDLCISLTLRATQQSEKNTLPGENASSTDEVEQLSKIESWWTFFRPSMRQQLSYRKCTEAAIRDKMFELMPQGYKRFRAYVSGGPLDAACCTSLFSAKLNDVKTETAITKYFDTKSYLAYTNQFRGSRSNSQTPSMRILHLRTHDRAVVTILPLNPHIVCSKGI